MTDLGITSSFSAENRSDSEAVDFDKAIKLESSGSTCHSYLVTINHHRYFVKKLKPQYRDKTLHRAALEKEFDIGSSLNHPSIPRYRSKGEDYIMTDYVEGSTLASMLKNNDEWLHKRHNIDKLINSLLEVISYMHSQNIVHCDIKADNIIITASTGNIMLVDFDKCHTSARNSTSGNPALYGVDKSKEGSTEIDFHALGLLLEQLKATVPHFPRRKYNSFIKGCFKSDATADMLSQTLNKRNYTPVILAVIGAALVFIILWLIRLDSRTVDEPTSDVQGTTEKIATAPVGSIAPYSPAPTEKAFETEPQPIIIEKAEPREKSPETGSQPRESETETLIKNQFSEMATYIMIGENAVNSAGSLSTGQLEDKISLLENRLQNVFKTTQNKLKTEKPELTDSEIDGLINSSPFYQKVKGKINEIINSLRSQIQSKSN